MSRSVSTADSFRAFFDLRLIKLKSKQARNESAVDTLRDIVGYCVIALMLHDETFNLELGSHG